MMNKKNKLRLLIPAYLLLVLCSFLFVFGSCKDNPVVPPKKIDTTYKFDTARFNWKVDTLRTYDETLYAYAQDPTHIYLASFTNFIYYDGINFNIYNFPNNFYPLIIRGLDNSHILIGGWINPHPYEKPAFLMWDGVSFKQVLVTDTVNASNSIYGLYPKSLNEIWLGLRYGIIKYDGTNFKYYNTDTTFANVKIFEQAGQLYCFSDMIFDPVNSATQCILEFSNDNWNKVYTVYNSSTYFLIGLGTIINNNFYVLKSDGNSGYLYKFTGNDISKIMDINRFIVNGTEQHFAGNTESDLLFSGYYKSVDTSFNLFNWNGNKWSKELPIGDGPIYVRGFQNNYIAISTAYYTLILSGTRK